MKNDNDDDDGFLLILIFLILLIFFLFFVLIKYRIIPMHIISKKEERVSIPKQKVLQIEDINISTYPLDILLSEYNITGPNSREEFIALRGDHFYRSVMLKSEPIKDLNISITDVIFETNRYTVFLIVYQAEQLIKAYKLYNSKRGISPTTINDLVHERILTMIPEQHELVTATGWKLSDNSNVGINNVSFIMNLDGLADNEMKLDFCNIVNFYANNQWSLQSTEADIIALGSGKSILENGYAADNDAFFCYSTGTTGEYKFQLVFAKWTGR
jgi:hypothetical protein